MNQSAFDLLERLAQAAVATLYREHRNQAERQMTLNIEVEIHDIEELLDKARHEQKGGA